MHNVAPVRALARRSRQLLTVALVLGALGALVVAIGIVLFVIPLVGDNSASFGLYQFTRFALLFLGGLLFLIALGLAIRAMTWKTDNELAQIVARVLEPQLDQRYTYIRNVSDRQLGYIDAILVGPPGVLTFRILNAPGTFANDGADWLKQNKRGDWLPWSIQPTRQVVADIQKLRELLGRFNLTDVPVYGVVVFTSEAPRTQLMAKNPVVPPTPLSTLMVNLQDNYLARERVDARRVADTVRTLYKN